MGGNWWEVKESEVVFLPETVRRKQQVKEAGMTLYLLKNVSKMQCISSKQLDIDLPAAIIGYRKPGPLYRRTQIWIALLVNHMYIVILSVQPNEMLALGTADQFQSQKSCPWNLLPPFDFHSSLLEPSGLIQRFEISCSQTRAWLCSWCHGDLVWVFWGWAKYSWDSTYVIYAMFDLWNSLAWQTQRKEQE